MGHKNEFGHFPNPSKIPIFVPAEKMRLFSFYMESREFVRLELSKGSCRENYKYFRSYLKDTTKLLVLVKANAYGHGAVQMATLLQEIGVDYLAVALPSEGAELRRAGITLPILVLEAAAGDFREIVDNHLEAAISDMNTLKRFVAVLSERKVENYPVHLAVDTGMHRLGFMENQLEEVESFLVNCPLVKVAGIYSHLAASDEPKHDEFTHSQAALFQKMASHITSAIGYKPMYHLLNSAGVERFSEYQFDMVRLGLGMYGLSCKPWVKLHPVASLKCKILLVKDLGPDDGTIGYGRWGKIPAEGMSSATIPVGYADGIDRRLGRGAASFSIDGKRVPTVGNICMDMCMVDVTGTGAKAGDTVTIFGDDPTIAELADVIGTIPYEILTRLARRVVRLVVD